MKKFYLLLFVLFLTNLCFAQTPLSVLGINPNTTMKKFNLELSKKGIKPTQTVDGLYEYKVKYAGYVNCTMEVKYNIGNDSISKVTIDIPHESYSKDKAIFENLTKQFKEKYGNETALDDDLAKIQEEFTGKPVIRTSKNRTYGKVKINFCSIIWYFDDDEYEDGVSVVYYTNAKPDQKVAVSSDI